MTKNTIAGKRLIIAVNCYSGREGLLSALSFLFLATHFFFFGESDWERMFASRPNILPLVFTVIDDI